VIQIRIVSLDSYGKCGFLLLLLLLLQKNHFGRNFHNIGSCLLIILVNNAQAPNSSQDASEIQNQEKTIVDILIQPPRQLLCQL